MSLSAQVWSLVPSCNVDIHLRSDPVFSERGLPLADMTTGSLPREGSAFCHSASPLAFEQAAQTALEGSPATF